MHFSSCDKEGATTDKIRQLRLGEANFDFLPQAILRGSIEGIEEANQIKFSHYEDDLDGFDAAVLTIEPASDTSGSAKIERHDPLTVNYAVDLEPLRRPASSSPLVFMMHRYDKEPRDRITVFLPQKVASGAGISASIRRVLHALHIETNALIWEREDAPDL